MGRSVRAIPRRLVERLRPSGPDPVAAPDLTRLRRRLRRVEEKVGRLEQQVALLTTELADARAQGRRAAEIADLVTELLANEASRRDPEFVAILERYTRA